MSEMDWTNKNIHPSKIVKPGDEIEVMVLDINEERRRISLGIKHCKVNPWQEFAQTHQVGEKVRGSIRSITDFGIFLGLEGEIDGLVHLSDLSWSESPEVAVRTYKKGDEIEAVILALDPERERISLGIKQLESNPISTFLDSIDKNKAITGTVTEVNSERARIQLTDEIIGVLRVEDYSQDFTEDLTQELKIGQSLAVKVLHFDNKALEILVSHKALDSGSPKTKAPEKTIKANATLGDLLKEQMKQKGEDA